MTRVLRNLMCGAMVCVVAGCAANPALEESRLLVTQGKPEEAIALLESALRENPRNGEVRARLARERETLIVQLLAQGDGARAAGQRDAAEAAYRRALGVEPDNARAKAGLAAIERDQRHAKLLNDAEAGFRAGDLARAEAGARAVLAENPGHAGARGLLRRIVERAAGAETSSPVLKAALARPITLEFRDTPIRGVFEVIARVAGINFVFDKDVRTDLRTTIFVRDSNLDDVIRLLLITNQLERKVMNENSVLIFPNTPAKLREYQEMVVRSFYLANADAKQVLTMLRTLLKTRDIFVDEKLNLVVVKDTPDAMRLAEKLIAAQDLSEPEVMLEVEVLEVGTSRLQELGVRFPDRVQFQDPATLPPPAGTGAAVAALQRASGGLTGFVATPPIIVNLKQQDGIVKLLANPRIRVKNREKAKIHIGEKVPVITTTSTANVGVSSSVSYLEVGLKLDVEPNVYLEDEVAIKVALEVSNILETVDVSGTLAYRLGTRNAATTLRLKNGETQVLAGLISDEDRRSANKLPGLGDLPLLGRLFSSHNVTRNKSEIVLLITPRIVRNIARPETVAAEYHSGTEAAIGSRRLQIQPTPPRTLSFAPTPKAGAAAPPAVAFAPRAAAEARATAEPLSVLFAGPSQAAVGKEFVVTVGLPSGAEPRNARFELAYDPALFELVAPPGAKPATGRVALQVQHPGAGVAAAPVQVTLRVVAKTAASTQIRVENLLAQDAAGNNVAVAPPPPLSLSIVQ